MFDACATHIARTGSVGYSGQHRFVNFHTRANRRRRKVKGSALRRKTRHFHVERGSFGYQTFKPVVSTNLAQWCREKKRKKSSGIRKEAIRGKSVHVQQSVTDLLLASLAEVSLLLCLKKNCGKTRCKARHTLKSTFQLDSGCQGDLIYC